MRVLARRGFRLISLTRWDRTAGSVLAVSLLLTGPGWSKVNAANRPAAQKPESPLEKYIREGDRAFQEADFARALDLYRKVDALDSTPKTRLKVASCLQELGQLAEAFDAYEAILKEENAALEPKDRAKVEEAMQGLRAATVALVIEVKEPGAKVVVNGVELGSGSLERSERRKPGRAAITVTKAGFETWSQVFDLSAGKEQRVTVELTPEQAKGSLAVQVNGKEPARLILDGKDIGALPWNGTIVAGEHTLIAQSKNGGSAPRRVNVSPNGTLELELAMLENPGRIRVIPADPNAVIRIDGIPYGTGRFEGEVASGKHVVSVEHEGFAPKTMDVSLEPGGHTELDNVVLERLTRSAPKVAAPKYEGMYTFLGVNGLFGRKSPALVANCPATGPSGGSCSSWPTLGAELELRVGYSFGKFGIEGFVLGGSNFSSAKVDVPRDVSSTESAWYGIARRERWMIYEPVFGGGVAGRVSTPGKSVRLSTALGFGVVWRSVELHRSIDSRTFETQDSIMRRDSTSLSESRAGRAAPLVTLDSDIHLGDTPGTRLFLGLHAQVEMGTQPVVGAGTGNLGFDRATGEHLPLGGSAVEMRHSPVFYIGPRFGVVVGH